LIKRKNPVHPVKKIKKLSMVTPPDWRYTGLSVAGTSHHHTGIPCQDAHKIACIGDALVAVVADGAGSVRHSGIASEFVVDATIAQIDAWENLPNNQDEWQRMAAILVEGLYQQLTTKAVELNCPVREVATTWLVALITENAVAAAQIGDGAIVFGADSEHLNLLTFPEHGEYLNETVFLVSEGYQKHLQTVYIQEQVCRAALFSDGLQLLALTMTTSPPTPYLPFFHPLFEFLHSVKDNAERERQLRNFLESPRVCSRTDDDKTLILAMRV
jgi:hypothetical protein